MNIYDNRIYKKLKAVYYALIGRIFGSTGMPITVNGFRLRFHPKHCRWFPDGYEHNNFDFIKDYVAPGSVCVDVGAHFGLYAIILAKYNNSRVYGFEPTSYSAEIFSENIRYNLVDEKIDVIQKAVSSKIGQLTFYVQDTHGAVSNSLVDYWHSDENKNKVLVEVVTIDSFFDDIKYDFLKIDAEGVEYDVLIGATQTIKKYKPKIILALHPNALVARGHSLRLIWEKLNDLDYLCYFGKSRMTEDVFCSKIDLFDVSLLHKSHGYAD